jgi:hypothetical protein
MYDEVVERFLFFSLHNIRLGLAFRTPASCQALWMVAFFMQSRHLFLVPFCFELLSNTGFFFLPEAFKQRTR